MDTLDNIINLEDYKLKKETAEVTAYMQEVRTAIVQHRQGKILVALHYLLGSEREYGFLSEDEIIEVANIFSRQVGDGITIP